MEIITQKMIKDLRERVKPFKIFELATRIKMNPNTLYAKIRGDRQFTAEEYRALDRYLREGK